MSTRSSCRQIDTVGRRDVVASRARHGNLEKRRFDSDPGAAPKTAAFTTAKVPNIRCSGTGSWAGIAHIALTATALNRVNKKFFGRADGSGCDGVNHCVHHAGLSGRGAMFQAASKTRQDKTA